MTERTEGFLDKVYGLQGADDTKTLYEDWATTYDAEVKANGYATPERCVKALSAIAGDKTAPLLDLGCGTGLSGEAFHAAGFTTIDGTDFSPEMLQVAKRKGVYRTLTVGDLLTPIPAQPGDYAHMAAVGVFSPGHAPAEMIEQVIALLPKGGGFVFSLNDHALEDSSYEETIRKLEAAGTVEVTSNEYGDHLPGRGLKSAVLCLRKL